MHLLIPAAGMGKRMGRNKNKLLLEVQSKTLLSWTLLAANGAPTISWIGIISQSHDRGYFEEIISEQQLTKPMQFIPGGSTRQESVYNGLQGLPRDARKVLIHDGARCLATPDLFDRCAVAMEGCNGLIAAVPVKDTIKVINQSGIVQSTPKRGNLWAAQTPQGFDVMLLKQCHQKGISKGWEVTDDAALFERAGLEVHVIEGEETNLKVTTPQDLAIAESILASRLGNRGEDYNEKPINS